MYKTSFFEAVASSNLERFHSETIAWIFNTFPQTGKRFIKEIHQINLAENKIVNENEIILIFDAYNKYCYAEIKQIDILINYSFEGKNHQIIVENKLKASEHFIGLDKYKNLLKTNEKNVLYKNNISQTQYYYLRAKKGETANLGIEKFAIELKNIFFVFLKPTIINDLETIGILTNSPEFLEIEKNFNFKKCNIWIEEFDGQTTPNPWLTITYQKLVKWIENEITPKKEVNATLAKGYFQFIKDHINEDVDLLNFNNNRFGQFDYFKLLFALVKSKLRPNNLDLKSFIQSSSSNSNLPLFSFYINKTVKQDFFKIINKSNQKLVPGGMLREINIGIQLQGSTCKYYLSADAEYYDYLEVIQEEKVKYKDFCNKILKKITCNYSKEFPNPEKGFHPNSSKTFYSRSYIIDNFIGNSQTEYKRNIKNISEEISIKVNHFVEMLNSGKVEIIIEEFKK